MSPFSLLINGESHTSEQTFGVINPATETVFAEAPNASDNALDAAVNAANAAFPAWKNTSFEARGEVLEAIADVIDQHADELIDILISEQGKSRFQAEMEVLQMGAGGLRTRAGLNIRPEVLRDDNNALIELHYRPLGAVAAIVPWNYPFGIAIGKFASALMAGCTVVLKPSPYTPLSMLKLGELIKHVVPAGVLNIISGDDSLGPKLTAHPGIAKITFTGSTATGKKVMAGAARDLKRVTLELGGNDPAIVLPDANIERRALALFLGAFGNSGQICVAIKRVYAHADIYEKLLGAFAAIASQMKVGPGADATSQLGPIQNRAQYEKVLAVLEDTKRNGGRIVCGGEPLPGPGYFLPPTVVADVSDGCRLVDEETFGPILPVIRYHDIDDALQRANSGSFGLGASIWSENIPQATALAKRLESGTAWVNQHPALNPLVPFAGARESGLGVESHELGLKEFCQVHVVNVAKSA